jgi:hypothetical protein
MSSRVALLIMVSLFVGSGEREASAQHFGKNKVEYVQFDFKVFETKHFAVYHYPAEETGARIVARLAERWYARLSRVLEHELNGQQSLILYGSQPEFAQTNVVEAFLGEGIGGITESARRRIVMPFAPTLAETDRILGHELTHAFQFDMARRYRGGMSWPLWAIEGLAQYLSIGASDVETAMWLRDAVAHDLLPERQDEAARKFSPYRYGHAMWTYMAGRFGDRVIPDILKARQAGTLPRRIKAATGLELDEVFVDWRQAAHELYGSGEQPARSPRPSPLLSGISAGRLYLGPSISPDGSRAVFFSEKDRLSLELFLADTETGAVLRKLATTAASVRFESLQAIRSAGSWSPEGRRFVFAAIERGRPALVVLDIERPGQQQEIRLPQFGQVLSPSWSPDGRVIAFSALVGGLTDLYTYDLESGATRQITNDAYLALHPEWSPDGQRLAFVTDRFSSDLATLRFGPSELAVLDLRSGSVQRLPALNGSAHLNPQWSADGGSLYFVSAPGGISNIFRVDLGSSEVLQITDVSGGISGLTPTSPAMSVARGAPVLAFTQYRKGKYDIQTLRGALALEGHVPNGSVPDASTLPPIPRAGAVVEPLIADDTFGLPEPAPLQARAYVPNLFLEGIGSPYLSSGGGPFGSFVRGGGSFLLSDMLGERKLGVAVQAGSRLRDLAVRVQFLNREQRWNWGAVGEVLPSMRRLPRSWLHQADAEYTSELHYFERTEVRLAGLLAYPLDRAQRIEFEAGVRHSVYRQRVNEVVRSVPSGRVLNRSITDLAGLAPASAGEASAAYVRDTAVFGPVGPILGGRSRLQVGSVVGELGGISVLLDHRRYAMPLKPYTIAMRVMHLGQYGGEAGDARWLPMFLGSRDFLRGYDWGTLRCQPNGDGECGGYHELLGRRLVVGNAELRAPLLGMRSRDIHYGPLPAEGFVFADAGLVWSRAPAFSAAERDRRLVRSFGVGVRLNAFGLPLECAAVRATDRPSRGWSFGLSLRPSF